MKKPFLFAIAIFYFLLPLSAQHHPLGHGNGYGNNPHASYSANHQLRYATMDNGRRIVLFPDGTWDFAPQQPPPPPPTPVFRSEFWGQYLLVKQDGKEVDKIRVSMNTQYDRERNLTADLAIGNAAYTFEEKTGEVRFLGIELIGKVRSPSDAKGVAAFHFTNEIYNGISTEFWGSYIIIRKFGQEIDKIRTSYNTEYERGTHCLTAGVTIGMANYQFNECDRRVNLLGNQTVGKAFSVGGAKNVAAFHFIRKYVEAGHCG